MSGQYCSREGHTDSPLLPAPARPSGHPKKKFVSCTAGGRNYGQSGGRKIFFFFFFFGFCKKIVKIILKKIGIVGNEKKGPSRPS